MPRGFAAVGFGCGECFDAGVSGWVLLWGCRGRDRGLVGFRGRFWGIGLGLVVAGLADCGAGVGFMCLFLINTHSAACRVR